MDGEIPNGFFRFCDMVGARFNDFEIAVILWRNGVEIVAEEREHVTIQAIGLREG